MAVPAKDVAARGTADKLPRIVPRLCPRIVPADCARGLCLGTWGDKLRGIVRGNPPHAATSAAISATSPAVSSAALPTTRPAARFCRRGNTRDTPRRQVKQQDSCQASRTVFFKYCLGAAVSAVTSVATHAVTRPAARAATSVASVPH